MRKCATGLALSSLVLAIGISHTTLVYSSDCNKQEYQSLLKIKNLDVLHRINELNLSGAQKSQFEEMKAKFDTENKKFMDQLKSTYTAMNQIVASPTIDKTQLETFLSDVKKAIILGQSQTATFRHNLYNLLNDTQKAKYHELQQQERQAFRIGLECPNMPMKAHPNLDPLDHIKELNLTPEQKSKIMPLITSNREQEKKLLLEFDNSAMSVDQMEKQIVQSTSVIDSTKLNDFAISQANNVEELQKNRLMTYHEIYVNLNPQQQIKFMTLLNNQLPK